MADPTGAPGGPNNAGISQDWQSLTETAAAVKTAMDQATAIIAGQQAEARTFITEYGAEVVGGHSPVAEGAENVAGGADFGGPGNSGNADG